MQPNSSLANKLRDDSPEQRARAAEEFIAALHSDLESLLALAARDAKEGQRMDPASGAYHAIEILRFARFSPAAELCVQQLETRSTAFPIASNERETHFPYFPFAVTAAAIGTPALPQLTAAIRSADSATTRFQLSCLAVKEILGEELAIHHLTMATPSEKLEQATLLLRSPTEKWNAAQCSDYSIH